MKITPERLAELDQHCDVHTMLHCGENTDLVCDYNCDMTYDEFRELIRRARLYTLARAECDAWRAWNDPTDLTISQGKEATAALRRARAALDAAEKEGT